MKLLHSFLWHLGCLAYWAVGFLCLTLSNLDETIKLTLVGALFVSWSWLLRYADRVPRWISTCIALVFATLLGLKVVNLYLNRNNPDYHFSCIPPYIPELLELKRTQNNDGVYQRLPSLLQLLAAHVKLSTEILLKRNQQHNQLYHTLVPGIGSVHFYYSFENVKAQIHEIFAKRIYAFQASTDTPYIVDCGSNIGFSVLFFKKLYPHSSIMAFEPAPDSFAALELNIKNNGLSGITTHQRAVFSTTSVRKIARKLVSDGSAQLSILQEATQDTIELNCVKLSDYLDKPVDLLKLDVEGAEHAVMDDLIASKKIDLIKQAIIEFHNVRFEADQPLLSNFLEKLETNGFEYQINTAYETPFNPGHYHPILVFAYRKAT